MVGSADCVGDVVDAPFFAQATPRTTDAKDESGFAWQAASTFVLRSDVAAGTFIADAVLFTSVWRSASAPARCWAHDFCTTGAAVADGAEGAPPADTLEPAAHPLANANAARIDERTNPAASRFFAMARP